ncbi:hypothetical protein AB0M50_55000 [Nonomuraea fuscirosea]|uniref:hypothetical protein n=1 Tax=Nonomuraea fuscirosea TaxID=1291556 RepID=UPI003422149E
MDGLTVFLPRDNDGERLPGVMHRAAGADGHDKVVFGESRSGRAEGVGVDLVIRLHGEGDELLAAIPAA